MYKRQGHAVLVSEPFVGDEPFGVFLGDDIIESETPAMQQLLDVFGENPGTILGVQEIAPDAVSRYGIVKTVPVDGSSGGLLRVTDVVEKPALSEAPSNLAIMGRYILMPEIFQSLRKTMTGAIGEIQLTDGIRGLIERGCPVFAHQFHGRRYDAGDKLEHLIATVELALKHEDVGPAFRDYLLQLKLEVDRP